MLQGNRKKIIFILGAFLAGMLTVIVWYYLFDNNQKELSTDSNCTSNYIFINPEPDCETFDARVAVLKNLNNELEKRVDEYLSEEKATKISVWSRDLTTRQWIGINELETYAPASLLKIPIMIAYFKFAELQPDILSKEFVYDGKTDLNNLEQIRSSNSLTPGKSYSVEELIERMIKYSDNNAADILISNIQAEFFEKILLDLGIKTPSKVKSIDDFVTAKSYANIFRILYNSSFMNRKLSNKALELLSETDFNEGATSKLPPSIRVSHKFAERSLLSGKDEVQEFHECGIVYSNNGPYSFCFMTKGKNLETLEKIVSDLSLFMYESYERPRVES